MENEPKRLTVSVLSQKLREEDFKKHEKLIERLNDFMTRDNTNVDPGSISRGRNQTVVDRGGNVLGYLDKYGKFHEDRNYNSGPASEKSAGWLSRLRKR